MGRCLNVVRPLPLLEAHTTISVPELAGYLQRRTFPTSLLAAFRRAAHRHEAMLFGGL